MLYTFRVHKRFDTRILQFAAKNMGMDKIKNVRVDLDEKANEGIINHSFILGEIWKG